jgi:hypothetical protein
MASSAGVLGVIGEMGLEEAELDCEEDFLVLGMLMAVFGLP